MSNRTDYLRGLRALADLLENVDEMPLPGAGTVLPLILLTAKGDTATAAARALIAHLDNHTTTLMHDELLIAGRIHGLRIRLYVPAADAADLATAGGEPR